MIDESSLKGFKLIAATLGVCLGTLLISLDQFIANVSIPTISGDLGVSRDDGAWVITSYIVANAIMVPLTGWLTSLFGRVRLFILSTFLFVIMSVLCGLSVSFPMLLFFRVLQGLVSGSLIPLSQALLLALFPKKKGFAMGMWGLVVMVGPAMGPVVGGWVTDNINWRWIFYINVPVGIVAGMLAFILLSHLESVRKKLPIDIVGLSLLIIAVGAYQVMLDRGNDDDWFNSRFIISLAIISILGFSYLIIWELTQKHPAVDLTVFKDRNFTLGSLIIGVAMFIVFGNLVVAPLWAFSELNYTPLWGGYSIAFFGVASAIFFPLVGQNLHLMDLRLWVILGFLLMGLPFFYFSTLSSETPFFQLAWPRFFQGIGFAFFYVPLTTVSLERISDQQMASAAGMFSFTRTLFISSGVSLATNYFSRREVFFQSRYVDYIIPSNPQFANYFRAIQEKLGLNHLKASEFVMQIVQREAFTETYLELCYLSGWALTILAFLSVFFKVTKKVPDVSKVLLD